jgi:hypothetical protein
LPSRSVETVGSGTVVKDEVLFDRFSTDLPLAFSVPSAL